MHTMTGSIDTRENWIAEFKATEYHEWFGYETLEDMKNSGSDCSDWSKYLIEVREDENGDWEVIGG